MDNGIRTISDLESEIQYLKKLLDDNGISYDYEAHLRTLQSDVGILSSRNWGQNTQVCCIRILRDEGMFMRREHAMVKATIHGVIISGSQESVLKGVVSR